MNVVRYVVPLELKITPQYVYPLLDVCLVEVFSVRLVGVLGNGILTDIPSEFDSHHWLSMVAR